MTNVPITPITRIRTEDAVRLGGSRLPPSLLLFLAWRNLSRSRGATFLIVAAVAGGLGFQVPVSANLLGYQSEVVDDGLRSGWGDVRIRPTGTEPLDAADDVVRIARADPDVVEAIPMLTLGGAIGKGSRFNGTAINGIDGSSLVVPYVIVAGGPLATGDHHGVLVGTAVARRLGLAVGDVARLRVVFSVGPTLLPEEDIGRYEMVVRGLAGGAFFGHESVFVDRSFLASAAGLEGKATLVMVHTADHFGAGRVARRLSGKLGRARILPWADDSPYLRNAVAATKAIDAASSTMAVVAVVIPVLALLAVSVAGQRRQIAVIAAVGFSAWEIFLIHLLGAVIIGLMGVTLGCAVGLAIIEWFRAHPIFEWEGFVLRPVLTVEAVLRPALSVFLATLVAGAYPAWRAARTDPAVVLKGT